MSQINQSDVPPFQVGNHFSATRERPPHIDDLRSNQYKPNDAGSRLHAATLFDQAEFTGGEAYRR